jgi:photosystem II stability/assembly factor-like uncharacterized protein
MASDPRTETVADVVGSLDWRLIGPFRGGRATSVAGHPTNPLCFYFGACAGGVWKTQDGGQHWRNVSDGFFRTASVGAIAIADSAPETIYVGMGEACIRENVLHGDGVYRSDDGGVTWRHLGLQDTRQISRIRVHPQNPDLVYVGAFGHAFGPNPERGLYRSRDGGKTFERVLFVDDQSGVIDLSMDPQHPSILYAATYEAHRTPYSLEAGGPGSRLYRTMDGGDTWEEITGRPGIPEGVKGRLAVAAAPRAGRVYLSLEMSGPDGGMYRTDDYGEHWTKLTDNPELRQRPWYFSHIFADPVDADRLYVINFESWRSLDGGKTYEKMAAGHVDHHDLWIDPKNPQRMINGHDGGAAVSFDGGVSWSTLLNQPTAQFYHVTTDSRYPFRAYGTQQDNSSLSVPSRTDAGAITASSWFTVGGGESGYVAVRPDNPDIVYTGNYNLLTRYHHPSREVRNILAWPADVSGAGAKEARYRFQWTSPMFISPHDPHTLYHAANVVFRSRDEGASWEVVSPDLTRDDKTKQESSGGPVTKDNTSAEFYCTIFALAESPVTEGVIWAGSDDGLVHLTKDGGAHWTNVTPRDLPEWALISIIDASPRDAGTAYVAATRYKSDGLEPLLYRTRDFGATWDRIVTGIPDDEPTRVVRADPLRPGMLWAGTGRGVYVSDDDGDRWAPLQLNLPVVPVWDIAFNGASVVLGTHGRGFYVMDDASPLRALFDMDDHATVRLFPMAPVVRPRGGRGGGRDAAAGVAMVENDMVAFERTYGRDGEPETRWLDAGQNPPAGVVVHYYVGEDAHVDAETPLTITVRDREGTELKVFSSHPADPRPGEKAGPKLNARPGAHRVVWDGRYPDALPMPNAVYRGGGSRGPLAPPGRYRVELKLGDTELVQHVDLVRDPRLEASDEDLQAQFDLLLTIRDEVTRVHQAVFRIRRTREAVQHYQGLAQGEAAEALKEAAAALLGQLEELEGELHQTKALSSKDLLNVPGKLAQRLVSLSGAVGMGQSRPSRQMYDVHAELSQRTEALLARVAGVFAEQGAQFAEAVAAAHLPVLPAE